jgi:hypothetical protein
MYPTQPFVMSLRVVVLHECDLTLQMRIFVRRSICSEHALVAETSEAIAVLESITT